MATILEYINLITGLLAALGTLLAVALPLYVMLRNSAKALQKTTSVIEVLHILDDTANSDEVKRAVKFVSGGDIGGSLTSDQKAALDSVIGRLSSADVKHIDKAVGRTRLDNRILDLKNRMKGRIKLGPKVRQALKKGGH